MMDSYNLAWKLAHSIHGLTPSSSNGGADPILETFEQERVDTARQLIEFDTKFSHMFSGQIGSEDAAAAGLTHDEFLRVFSEGSGFTSGCGLQYQPSKIVRTLDESRLANPPKGDPLNGTLTPGRRILNVELKRFADANVRQLHDELPSTGRYRLIVIANDDLLNPNGASQSAMQSCSDIVQKFPVGVIDLAVLHPLKERFEWTDLPACVKKMAEMRTYGLARKEDAYDIYGISKEEGVIVAIRPDGYVGMLAPLTAPGTVEEYFRGCLVET